METAEFDALVARVTAVHHGFGPMQREAAVLAAGHEPGAIRRIVEQLFAAPAHQVRMTAVLLAEAIAGDPATLAWGREVVSADPSWQVQEMLGRLFDAHCRATGYEIALPAIDSWLTDPRPNVRRAVSEGLRIWTGRDWFREHPGDAIARLATLRNDPSPYVRKSAGNALRDISRAHPALVRAELAGWDLADRSTAAVFKLANGWLARQPEHGEPGAVAGE